MYKPIRAAVLPVKSSGPSTVRSSATRAFKTSLEAREYSGSGRQRNQGILQRHAQGCVEPWRGFRDPIVPLSVPTGVQLSPTSPKLVEGRFSELRLAGVLGCSLAATTPSGQYNCAFGAADYEDAKNVVD